MPQKPINIAVVGCGHIGRRHASVIRANPSLRLLALCDIRPKQETEIDFDEVPFFSDLSIMLREMPDIDIVSVATPNGLHEEHALLALQHHKHVIIEKPMALTSAGCQRIIDESLSQKKNIFCVMQNRFSPPALWLKDILSRHLLGEIFMVQVNCFWNRDERYYINDTWHGCGLKDGGTIFTQFSHFIDILYWLFGGITNIDARFFDFKHQEQTDFEDSGSVLFDFESGGKGNFNFSTAVWDKNLESSITLIAEKGTVKIGGQYMNQVELCNINNYSMPTLDPVNPPNDYGTYTGSAANHHFIYENVVEVIHNHAAVAATAMEGMKVVEIIEKIYAAAIDRSYLEKKKRLP